MRILCVAAALLCASGAQAQPAYPAIPEPMIFDMMRPLGAARGETEINALAQTVSPFRPRSAEWAPELEYAYADGHAVEFELPFDGARLAALKIGLQSSLGVSPDGRTAHGVQYLGIYDRRERHYSNTLLYLLGHRYSARWSSMSMVGVDRIALNRRHGRNTALFNHAVFYDSKPGTVLGAELNVAGGADGGVKLSPQIHHALSHGISLQLAAGMEKARHESARPTAGIRIIRQF